MKTKNQKLRIFTRSGHKIRYTWSKKYGYEYRISGPSYNGEGYEDTIKDRAFIVASLIRRSLCRS